MTKENYAMMNMFKYITDYFRISRPFNVLIAVISVWVAAFISPDFHWTFRLTLAMIIAGFITAGANIINDIYDIEIDRINKPERPLPSGQITLKEAWMFFLFSYISGIGISVFCGWCMFIIAFTIGLLLMYYSFHLKRTVLWGNITVSLASAMAFIFGAMSVGNWQVGLIPASFAFLFHLGREILKDMQDLKGDLKNQSITFPARFGLKTSVLLINTIFIFLILLTILPYILKLYDAIYLWIVVLGVHTVILFVNVVLWFNKDPKMLGKLSHLLKIDMLVGLAAIYLGS